MIGVDLVGPLVADPGVDQVLGEDAALEQEGVIALERRNASAREPGVLRMPAESFSRRLVEIEVGRAPGSIWFLTPSRPAISNAAKQRYGIRGGVRAAELDPLALRLVE